MTDKYDLDLNNLDQEQLDQIREIITCASIGRVFLPKHSKKRSFVKDEAGRLVACDFLGCAFIGKYGLENARYATDAAQWGILIYQSGSSVKDNSLCVHIKYLSDAVGYQAAYDFLQDILDEYEDRNNIVKEKLKQRVQFVDITNKIKENPSEKYLRLNELLEQLHIWKEDLNE